jgi:adenylate kinase
MIKNEIAGNQDVAGFIFDGFPRTLPQAEILDKMLADKNQEVNKVLSIIIPDEMVFERILHRATIENRKDDTDKSIIQTRIDLYHNKTMPLIEYYSAQGKYQEICGKGTVEEIFQKISENL